MLFKFQVTTFCRTKEANSGSKANLFEKGLVEHDWYNSTILRGRHVHHQASLLSDLAQKSEDIYNYIITKLDETYITTAKMEVDMHKGEDVIAVDSSCQNVMDELQSESPKWHIKDPHISQTKGRKKDNMKEIEVGRIKSGLEMSLKKILVKGTSCQFYGEHGHNQRGCKKKKDLECANNPTSTECKFLVCLFYTFFKIEDYTLTLI